MLAWVHQSIAAEREFLGLNTDGPMVGSIRKFDSTEEEDDWIRELKDMALGKLCMLLKVCMKFFLSPDSFALLIRCIR